MTRLPPISSLLSPPEPALLSDFDKENSDHAESQFYGDKFAMGATKQSPSLRRLAQPISPPVSPLVTQTNSTHVEPDSQTSQSIRTLPDPVLFPEHTHKDPHSVDSLFPGAPDDLLRFKIRQHIARRDAPSKSGDPRHSRKAMVMPTEEEYMGVVSGVSRIMTLYNRTPSAYVKAIQAQNEVDYKLTKGIQTKKPLAAKLDSLPRALTTPRPPKMSRVSSNGTVQKLAPSKRAPTRRSAPSSSLKAIRNPTPDEKAAPKKKTEDVDFNSLPDLSPPISTLDNGQSLHVEWTANPLNLSEDPHRHLLHEAEVRVASALRLTCATYLCTKRRIFIARVQSMKRGKEFRKTDAQQACKIDVNKASKLWTAYDNVGWFNRDHVTQHLNKTLE